MSLGTRAAQHLTFAFPVVWARCFLLTVLAAALLSAVALPGAAMGADVRLQISSFDGSDTNAGAIAAIGRTAIHQASGTVYAVDTSAGVVDRFDAAGVAGDFPALNSSSLDGTAVTAPDGPVAFSFYGESDLAVDNSGTASDGNLVVLAEFQQTAWVFDATGAYQHQITGFGDPCGAAVDSGGNVWIADYSTQTVSQYTAAGVATGTTISTAAQGPACHIAFDSNDDLYAMIYAGATWKYTAAGGYEEAAQIDPEAGITLTVDRGTHEVYIGHAVPSRVSVYGAGGDKLYDFAQAGSVPLGVAVNESTGRAYVADSSDNDVHVFGPPVLVVRTAAATNITSSTATLNGAVDPQGGEVTGCHFEYGTDTSYGQTAPCEETVGSGNDPVSVHADVTGLVATQDYHVRLVAENAITSLAGADAQFFTPTPPQIVSTSVSDVTDSEAKLRAQINPVSLATTYHFEYGLDSSYGHSTAESASIGSDTSAHLVIRLLSGLAPGTTYHWRVVATNSLGSTDGPDLTFTTYGQPTGSQSCPNARFRTLGAAAALPNCRAYEMVTPVDKNNANIAVGCNTACQRAETVQSSLNGDKFTYSAATAFGDQPSAPFSSQYLASRAADGWSNHGINAPRDSTTSSGGLSTDDINKQYDAFTADLSQAWLFNNNASPLTADGIAGGFNLYKRDNLTGSYHTIAIDGSTAAGRIVGRSADGRHTVFCAATQTCTRLFDNVDSESHVVNVLPGGAISQAPHLGTFHGRNLSDIADYGDAATDRAVSSDGSRIFWSDGGGDPDDPGDLYVRIDGETTVAIAESANFRVASTDGSKVVFDTATDLGYTGLNGSLYEFDVDSHALRLIADEQAGVLGASEDLSYIYFGSRTNLAAGASAGENNLYVDHNGTVSFIATLSTKDLGFIGTSTVASATARQPRERTARVTPDGTRIVFQSDRSLTGYDNTDAVRGTADIEVFTYHAENDQLLCVSCNRSGARPVGQALRQPFTANDTPMVNGGGLIAAAWVPASPSSLYSTRVLSEDGSRIFFNSYDALVPRDTNSAQDVYQWQGAGSGGCQTEEGCVDLISSGQSPAKSEFIDADPPGENVFFETASSLVAQDNGLVDIYDARVGGGFEPPTAMANGCQGAACQSANLEPERNSITTTGSGGGKSSTPSRATVKVGSLSSSQRRGLAAGARVRLRVTVNRAGSVRLRGTSRLGNGQTTVLSARATARRAGAVTLTLRLSAAARRRLARTGELKVSLAVSFSNAARPATSELRLTRAHKTTTGSTNGRQSR